jgi:uncharacterized membrane protein YphA (DoxX/SURF4 family)
MEPLSAYLLPLEPTIFIIARLLVGFFFLFFGIWNLLHWKPTLEFMEQKKIPLATFALGFGIALEILCSLMIIADIDVQIAVLLLIPFVIVAVFIFHAFWNFEGDIRRLNMLCFITNLTSTLAALLLLLHAPETASTVIALFH